MPFKSSEEERLENGRLQPSDNIAEEGAMKQKGMIIAVALALIAAGIAFARTEKPILHGRHWVAITGKPLGATAGASIFLKGGNAVDAACGMLGAVCTMYDVLSWGGETQALIYNPKTKKVVAINALGVAPTGATSEYFKQKGLNTRRPTDRWRP
jgi:gamma-glutamyltranspeptidase/glutathione hydrolase